MVSGVDMSLSMYSLLRPLLFRLDPETAHHLTLKLLHYLPEACFSKPKALGVSAFGLEFSHPLGLAAGLDKNAEHLDALSKLGFSFIEVGTTTPRPQEGNPKPRLFRIPRASALLNRMGFNNQGVDALVLNIKASSYEGILGINIGKNKDTPMDKAVDDYLYCLQRVYLQASYVTVNISSPNTPGLRALQAGAYFQVLMSALREEQLHLSDKHQRYVPLVVKISPDETDETLQRMCDVMLAEGVDGIIASNTTCFHQAVKGMVHGGEAGGLSGQPLARQSTHCLKVLKAVVGDDITLIGVGGIDNGVVAVEKLEAGATLLQLYTGLVYQGPGLVSQLVDAIINRPDLKSLALSDDKRYNS